MGLTSLELSHLVFEPGWGLGVRGIVRAGEIGQVTLDAAAFNLLTEDNRFDGVIVTGAVYVPRYGPFPVLR